MKPKHVVTVVLLLFVVGSVAYMIVQERKAASVPPETIVSEEKTEAAMQVDLKAPENPEAAQPRQVIVYYFHGDVRCPTCHKLEDYAREAVETNFAEELGTGLIQWKPVNVDRTENAHFVKDYKLVTKAVILSNVTDGREAAWKNLDKIWDLVGNKEGYLEYIRENLKTFLEEGPS